MYFLPAEAPHLHVRGSTPAAARALNMTPFMYKALVKQRSHHHRETRESKATNKVQMEQRSHEGPRRAPRKTQFKHPPDVVPYRAASWGYSARVKQAPIIIAPIIQTFAPSIQTGGLGREGVDGAPFGCFCCFRLASGCSYWLSTPKNIKI